jgi:hypothetical protein
MDREQAERLLEALTKMQASLTAISQALTAIVRTNASR